MLISTSVHPLSRPSDTQTLTMYLPDGNFQSPDNVHCLPVSVPSDTGVRVNESGNVPPCVYASAQSARVHNFQSVPDIVSPGPEIATGKPSSDAVIVTALIGSLYSVALFGPLLVTPGAALITNDALATGF